MTTKPDFLTEETAEMLDEVLDAELAVEFINKHGEEYFQTYYETYERLVGEHSKELIDAFADHFDIDSVEHFDDMYQGEYEDGAEFAEMICTDCGYISRDMPSWIEIDWKKTWENALSYDYTEIADGHIFNDNY